jgi:hypothetical protein
MIRSDALCLTALCIICLGLGNIVQVYIDFLFEGSWFLLKYTFLLLHGLDFIKTEFLSVHSID